MLPVPVKWQAMPSAAPIALQTAKVVVDPSLQAVAERRNTILLHKCKILADFRVWHDND